MQGKQAKILGSAPQGMLLFRERVVAEEERRADEERHRRLRAPATSGRDDYALDSHAPRPRAPTLRSPPAPSAPESPVVNGKT